MTPLTTDRFLKTKNSEVQARIGTDGLYFETNRANFPVFVRTIIRSI
jgi:hypothetical protein